MSEQKTKPEEIPTNENSQTPKDLISREWMELNVGNQKLPVAQKIELPDGRIVRIAKGQAIHSMTAQDESIPEGSDKGDSHRFQAALLSLLVSIDNKFLSTDDWLYMDMTTYNKVWPSFAAVNF